MLFLLWWLVGIAAATGEWQVNDLFDGSLSAPLPLVWMVFFWDEPDPVGKKLRQSTPAVCFGKLSTQVFLLTLWVFLSGVAKGAPLHSGLPCYALCCLAAVSISDTEPKMDAAILPDEGSLLACCLLLLLSSHTTVTRHVEKMASKHNKKYFGVFIWGKLRNALKSYFWWFFL